MPCFTNLISGGGTSSGGGSYCKDITGERVLIRKEIPTATMGSDNSSFYIRSTTDGTNIYIFRYAYGLYKFNGTTITQMTLPVDNVTYLTGCTIIWHNGTLHMIGGIKRSSSSTDPTCIYDHYKYTPTGWVKLSTLPVPMYHGSAVVYNGKLLIIENLHEADDNRSGDGDYYTNHKFAVYQFNDSTNKWSQFGPDIVSGRTEHRSIPALYTDGKSLFATRSFIPYVSSVTSQLYKYTPNGWIIWGENVNTPGNGDNNNSKYVNLLGNATFLKYDDIFVSRDTISWESYNPKCNFRFNCPLEVVNGEVYAISNDRNRIVERYTPATVFNLPAGATIYTNDTVLAGINGSKTLSSDDTITIANKPGIYATVVVGDILIYMQSDTRTHRVYGLRGMVINNTKVVSNGLITVPNIEHAIAVK